MKRCMVWLISLFLFPVHIYAEERNEYPEIISEAAILMDSNSGAVLYHKNAEEKMVPASLTKIATAIYAIEKGDLNEIVTVSKEAVAVKGTKVYLVEGEQVTLKHLLQGMLINSGNDAATAIALHLDGNMEIFTKNFNQYLRETIGIKNTHFTNPHGLYEEKHYTTAHDLALITNYALSNPIFKEIFGTKELAWHGKEWETTLITHHLLLKGDYPYAGITGGKTGFVNEAKQTLATTAENEQIELTAIVLKADFKKQIYRDTQLLLDYGFDNFRSDIINQSTVYQVEDKQFIADKDIPITRSIGEWRESLSANGKFELYNGYGDIIQTVKLKEVAPVQVESFSDTDGIKEVHRNEKVTGLNTLYLIVFFAFALMVIRARKRVTRF